MTHQHDVSYRTVLGHKITLIEPLGHLVVFHDGKIAWERLQAIKNRVWGDKVAAIEVYPPQDMVVNQLNARHLWRLGTEEMWPDMLGREPQLREAVSDYDDDLPRRYIRAWAEAWAVGRNPTRLPAA